MSARHRRAPRLAATPDHVVTRNDDYMPDLAHLEALLGDFLGSSTLRVTSRERNPRSSSSVSEIVHTSDGHSTLPLFLKYGSEYRDTWSAHRRGVPYETSVYEGIVEPWGGPAPRFIGRCVGPLGSVLAIEYVECAKRAHDPHRVETAARTLGEWHSRCEHWLAQSGAPVALNDHAAQMTSAISQSISARLDDEPTLAPLFGPILDSIHVVRARLADSRATVVHGELFPSNVVVVDERAYLVDWESAGIGAGELDLATLTAGDWGPETIDACRRAYSAARWPRNEPQEFAAALAVARVLVIAQLAWRSSRRETMPSSTIASLASQVTHLLSEVEG